MRVGEAIALDRDDVDLRERRLAIREAKHAARQLPLHPSTAKALRAYARRRDQLCPAPKARGFFLSTVGTSLIYECVRETFIKLRRSAGLEQAARPSPRIHEYADVFVMPTLVRWPCSERLSVSRCRDNQSASGKARSASGGW
jgi:integrase/recombinase XerD